MRSTTNCFDEGQTVQACAGRQNFGVGEKLLEHGPATRRVGRGLESNGGVRRGFQQVGESRLQSEGSEETENARVGGGGIARVGRGFGL